MKSSFFYSFHTRVYLFWFNSHQFHSEKYLSNIYYPQSIYDGNHRIIKVTQSLTSEDSGEEINATSIYNILDAKKGEDRNMGFFQLKNDFIDISPKKKNRWPIGT